MHQNPIPDPDDFDGTRANLRPFLTKLRLKIAGNATRFPNVQHQLRYAFGFLKGDAYATIEPHLVNDRLNFATLEEFTQVLKMAFGDPDETRTAALELLLGVSLLGFTSRSRGWESTDALGIWVSFGRLGKHGRAWDSGLSAHSWPVAHRCHRGYHFLCCLG